MPDTTFLGWPFFDDAHRQLAVEVEAWGEGSLSATAATGLPGEAIGLDAACRELVRRLGEGGWLRHVVPRAYGGACDRLDLRSICLLREALARRAGLADFAFALQGLGSGPLALFGSEAQKTSYLPRVCAGRAIAAFALSEAAAGSDVAAMRTTARRDGGGFVLDGEKSWISNAGIADFYVVFCRLPEGGDKSFAAFIVDADNPGLSITSRVDLIAPHPLGSLALNGCRVGPEALVGEAGKGLKVALATLDAFRPSVGAAAVGFARRALDETLGHVTRRHAFGQPLAEMQLTRARLADMATAIDASALLVYRAAWVRDQGAPRVTREAAMAKLYATEAAQRVIDDAVQLFGGHGVVAGEPVERLYREIRALRIYEGTSEIQKLVIAAQVLAAAAVLGANDPGAS